MTIDEAMVLGIGIIAPAIGGIPEQIERYKKSSLLDVSEIKKIILNWDLAENEQFDYRSSNLERVRKLRQVL